MSLSKGDSTVSRVDSLMPVLCQNEKGEPGFMIDKGKGVKEFKSVDVFLRSRSAAVASNNNGAVDKETGIRNISTEPSTKMKTNNGSPPPLLREN